MKVLISGATGCVGTVLCEFLATHGYDVVPVVRRPSGRRNEVVVGEIGALTDWSAALRNVACTVHLAARVHVMRDHVADPLTEFRAVNVAGTLGLARQAAEAGVKRFVFISSIKVNGEETPAGQPFDADAPAAPEDPYGVSKMEAEQGVREVSSQTGMEVVIIRSPLVYGPGVKGNFLTLMQWLSRGIPLPLGAIHNQRSLIALDNLVDMIVTCMSHPAAADQVFLVSDGEDMSTTELLRRMGAALGRPARLLPVPAAWLDGAARLLGKGAVAQRLCGSLQVDIEKTHRLLGWTPPVTVDEALRETARHFLAQR